VSHSVKNKHLSQAEVELQREQWWSALPVTELSDWGINLLGELLFRSGRRSLEHPIETSVISLRKRIGSHRNGGHVPAKRQRITEAATECSGLGLLRREESRKRWWLLSPATSSAPPAWLDFYRFNASLFRRTEVAGGCRVRAAAARLSFALAEDGSWKGSEVEAAAMLGVKSAMTAKKRLDEIENAKLGFSVSRDFAEGGAVVRVSCKTRSRKPRLSDGELRAELLRVRNQLWYPTLVDDAVRKVITVRGKDFTLERKLNSFYSPILDLQQKEVSKRYSPKVLEYALTETLRSQALDKPDPWYWHRYAKKVVETSRNDPQYRLGARPAATPKEETAQQAVSDRVQEIREKLEKAAQLNGGGDTEGARRLLPEILAASSDLASIFDGDQAVCENQLRLAFKQGSSDFKSAKVKRYSQIDFLPEWVLASS